MAHITLNKNSVVGDTSALVPGGIRIGTPAMTTRGMKEQDFVKVAEFIDRGVKIAIENRDCKQNDDITLLRSDVESYCSDFHIPGN
jgi:glycine hydroxymethyltransferase